MIADARNGVHAIGTVRYHTCWSMEPTRMSRTMYGQNMFLSRETCVGNVTFLMHEDSLRSGQNVVSIIAGRGNGDELRRFDQLIELDKEIRRKT